MLETCIMYIAIDRKRDNPNNTNKIAFRQIATGSDTDIEILKHKCKTLHPDKSFRIYRAVNRRSYEKAFSEFKHQLIENPDITKLDSLWKTCLLNPKCKAERHFLIDVDTEDPSECYQWLMDHNIPCIEYRQTPNGHHFITPPFDQREFNVPKSEIKKDALIFVMMVD